ncbi:ATP-dependent helicase [Oceanobacillus oncorhynchi subsp. incaldanensis]|uniref:RNA polymerase-associated protein RapA n=2 Tax=Oceanobacillus TaxID=182709 RepID=A0A0A1MZE3_9BACI|nr:SNF2-related protein [Oceanobacillus oncorhynchi]MDM8099431.1 SNF2-related protein [Oceanobacillus oncorhynchi]UUI38445.1 SNF2-related protein [Oceanobacillus oncorhynchi]GIO20954.1 ATP-dependent helicase [Oceanobacillus oncorhynchi subsp. incaldanensis]CEI84126.1 RNA polymerase-associated protein RapA [Oceanobacillus oncorhynchi]
MDSIQIQQDNQFITGLESAFRDENNLTNWELFRMAYQAANLTKRPSFNGLQALEYLPHLDILDHQLQAAEQVIETMHGRAILADEVGLGKTIEAGLVLKEYMVRGLVKKALILVPASLVNQWEKELNEKFLIPAIAYRKNYSWDDNPIIISSIDSAKRSPHREAILDIDYDFILVDEAHKLKNEQTKNYQFVQELKKKYCLLLTATPVQNKLLELFNLVSLLKPGHLGNYKSFTEKYGKDRKKMEQDPYLKKLVQQVMVRNTRKDTSLNNSKRKIQTIWTSLPESYHKVYHQLMELSFGMASFAKITYLREFCSSREACFTSLLKLDQDGNHEAIQEVIGNIEQLEQHPKAEELTNLIKSLNGEKVIVFTEYRATQYYLQWYLQQHGISSVPFRGGFKRGKKDWMKQLFRDHAQVLIATEAGGEGINLQFCHHLINYDLPWNPMRLEQRIGRIHRFGQESDVHIYNIVTKQTIEEHILSMLYEKINLFENVIGNLDAILAELKVDSMEKEIESIYQESTSAGEVRIKLDNLKYVMEQANQEIQNEEQYRDGTAN